MTSVEQALQKAAVVIPSIQGRPLLERLLPSIDVAPGQVVVVEQGSSDGSEAFCRSAGAQVLQLGRQATFTQACNAGIRWALERGFQYVCLANNDLQFVTPVVHRLLATCLDNPGTGAAAPTQVMVTGGKVEWVAYRATWDLSQLRFSHDIAPLENSPRDVEADFCEFTCALIPAGVLRDVGLLDDDYGFYHEDADWGYRAWVKGYRALYNQQAQVFHWGSSTVSTALGARRKRELIRANRARFAAKHLRYGVNFLQEIAPGADSAAGDGLIGGLSRTLRPLGLVRPDGPSFAVGMPGQTDARYLCLAGQPAQWGESERQALRNHEQLFISTEQAREQLAAAGFANAHLLPPGVDPNVFHPAGARMDLSGGRTLLAPATAQPDGALAALHAAWCAVRDRAPGVTLALLSAGDGLPDGWLGEAPVPAVQGKLYRRGYPKQRISLLHALSPLSERDRAALYRGADAVVDLAAGDGLALFALEALACGIPAILPDPGTRAGPVPAELCIAVRAGPAANGRGAPAAPELEQALLRALGMGNGERADLTRQARHWVVQHRTWRGAAAALRAHLARLQGEGAAGAAPGRGRGAWRSLEERWVRGYLAEGLLRTGGLLQKGAHMLRSQGLGRTLRKAAQFVAGRVRRG